MPIVVMNNSVFECSELYKDANATKSQDLGQQPRLSDCSDHQQHQATASCSSNLRRSYSSLVNLIEQHRKLDRSVSEPTSRYKTELCRPFEENGSCKYGDKCQFAHGYNELRNLARHPKYKTELCRTFHKIGFCPYGPRCHFVHNFEEARIHNLKVSSQLNQLPLTLQLQSQSVHHSEFIRQPSQSSLHQQNIGNSNTNTLVAGLTPLMQPVNINMSLLEHLASSPQVVAAVAAASVSVTSRNSLIRTNSLNLAAAAAAASVAATAAANATSSLDYPPRLTLQRSNSLGIPRPHRQHLYQHKLPHIQSRPKPLNLSPTFSLGSTADSTSPSSSLSQSPTNSMASFFSDDHGFNSCFPFSPNQDEIIDSSTRTPSPLLSAPVPMSECPRLPVFNRISQTIAELEHFHI